MAHPSCDSKPGAGLDQGRRHAIPPSHPNPRGSRTRHHFIRQSHERVTGLSHCSRRRPACSPRGVIAGSLRFAAIHTFNVRQQCHVELSASFSSFDAALRTLPAKVFSTSRSWSSDPNTEKKIFQSSWSHLSPCAESRTISDSFAILREPSIHCSSPEMIF